MSAPQRLPLPALEWIVDNRNEPRPGDRVRIDPRYWDREIAGRTGTIGDFPDGGTQNEGTVWIELDVVSTKPGEIDGVEVGVDDLQRI